MKKLVIYLNEQRTSTHVLTLSEHYKPSKPIEEDMKEIASTITNGNYHSFRLFKQ